MPAYTSTSHGSSISHHLQAIKGILQDVEYVLNGYDILHQMAKAPVCSVANTVLHQTEVGPMSEANM